MPWKDVTGEFGSAPAEPKRGQRAPWRWDDEHHL